jgi:hypothetical protein
LAKPKSLERLGFGNETSGIGRLLALRRRSRRSREIEGADESGISACIENFTIYREIDFTIRGGFFNAWNHAQFSYPDLRVAPNTFGQIGAIQHDARAAQSIRSRVGSIIALEAPGIRRFCFSTNLRQPELRFQTDLRYLDGWVTQLRLMSDQVIHSGVYIDSLTGQLTLYVYRVAFRRVVLVDGESAGK